MMARRASSPMYRAPPPDDEDKRPLSFRVKRRTPSPEPDDGLGKLRSHLYEGQYTEAIAELESFEAAVRARGDIQNVKGVCLLHLGRPERALEVLDDVLAANPADDAARHNRLEAVFSVCELRIEEANKRFLAGDAGGALACYELVPPGHLEELRTLYPQLLYTFYNNRGAVLMKLARFAPALEDFETAVAVRGNHGDAHHNRGVALKALKRFEEADSAFSKCLELDPRSYSALCGKSEVLASLDRFEDAVDVASRAIEVNDTPDNYRALLSRGFARLKHGEYGGAVRDFHVAEGLGAASDEFVMMYELALALHGDELFHIGEHELAIDLYTRALAMGSSDRPSVDLLFNLSLAKLYSGDDGDDTANGFRHVLSLRPNHPQAAGTLGMHLLEVSYPNSPEAHEACVWLKRATEMRPREADLFYHYGLALMKVGNMKLAGEVFRKCLDINPKHQMATDGLSRVEGFNAGFVVAAAVHRRRSQMGSAAGPETGMYTPGSPAGSSTLSKGTARSDASEILRERAHRRSNSLSSRSLGVDEVGSDGSYPVSPRAEIAFLKEQLGRRQDLIEDLQRQVAFLTEELTEARKAGVGASGSASGRSRRKPRKSLQGSYVYRGPAAFPEEHKKPRKRLSATSTTSADNLGRASLESRDGSILIDGPEEGAGKPKMSQVRPVLSASSAWGASSGETVDTEGTTGEVKQRQSIVSVVSLDEEPAVVQEIVGSENRGGRLSGTTAFKNSAYGADEKPPATSSAGTAQGASETDNNAGANSSRKSIRQTKSSSPNRQRNNNGQPRRTQLRRSLSRRHLQEYTPSVSIMDLTALDNTSSEDALIDMRFQLSVLQAPGPFPPGINIQERERYLTDKDFEAAFGVNRVEFTALSKWRRLAMKKELGLW